MGFLPLTGGAYQSRSLMAAAQSCINLIPESLPQSVGEPVEMVHLTTPGLRLFATIGTGPIRCLYRATNDVLYACSGSGIYSVTSAGVGTLLGTIISGSGIVSMSDNSLTLIIVDGYPTGYTVDLTTGAFATISDPAFYGANRVGCLDGFFVLNRPGTNQFYLSDALATTFNPLYIAAKAGLDRMVSLAVIAREAWMFGEARTEIYSNTGAADFPFASMSGGIEHGCAACFSVTRCESSLFWLSINREGRGFVLQGSNYQAHRVSTHAIETAIAGYARVDDATGFSYQIGGHTVYALSFPSGGATWAYDLSTQLWHQWSSSGLRHRGAVHAPAFNLNLVGDYATGAIYVLDTGTYTDNGAAIQRTRAFPHIRSDGKRVFFRNLKADMQCGTVAAGQAEPQLSLRWSDDAGASFGNTVQVGMGLSGAANTSLQFQRLGYGRTGRVFELSWNAPLATILTGAWIDTVVAGS